MAYHEYANGSHRHYNGHRLSSVGVVDHMSYNPDNGLVWENAARYHLVILHDRIGEIPYKAWWERSFERDGKNANNYTWKQINAAAQIALEYPETLECSCNGAGLQCAVCQSIDHVSKSK